VTAVAPAAAVQGVERFQAGTAVEYFSRSAGDWVPAVVAAFDERSGTYRLDIHPAAHPSKVRAAGKAEQPRDKKAPKLQRQRTTKVSAVEDEDSTEDGGVASQSTVSGSPDVAGPSVPAKVEPEHFADGTAVEYHSTTYGKWVPAIVQGFDQKSGVYILNIQPMAFPDKVRLPASSSLSARDSAKPATTEDGSERGQEPGPRCGLCKVCLPKETLKGPDCGHIFCAPCLRHHVLEADFLRSRVACPAEGCNVEVAGSLMFHAVGAEMYAERQAEIAREDAEMARRLAEEIAEEDRLAEERLERERVARENWEKAELARMAEEQREHGQSTGRAREEIRAGSASMGPTAAASSHAGAAHSHLLAAALQPVSDKAPAPEFGSSGMAISARGWQAAQRQPPRANSKSTNPFDTDDEEQPARSSSVAPPHNVAAASSAASSSHSQSASHALRREHQQANATIAGVSSASSSSHSQPAAHALRREHKPANATTAASSSAAVSSHSKRGEHVAREALPREKAGEQLAHLEQQRGFECPLCFDTIARDEAIELDCDHKLCVTCFRAYLESKISEAQVADDELVCPIPSCRTEITVAQIEGATRTSGLWDKFLQFRMNLWQPGSSDGKIVACPTPECGRFVVPANVEIVQCPVCSREFCPRCGQKGHQGVTCEAFQEWQRANSSAEQQFEELMAQQHWRRCPKCGAPSERESGCNFMQCRSEICRKRTFWCYICGKQFPRDEHYNHFPQGPYEDECNTPVAERLHGALPPRVPAAPVVASESAASKQPQRHFLVSAGPPAGGRPDHASGPSARGATGPVPAKAPAPGVPLTPMAAAIGEGVGALRGWLGIPAVNAT